MKTAGYHLFMLCLFTLMLPIGGFLIFALWLAFCLPEDELVD